MIDETAERNETKRVGLWSYVEQHKPQIETALHEFLPLAPACVETEFNDALRYALFPGGKRLRPVLTLLGAEIVGGDAESVLPAAIAVEFIHSSSLVFDDLPAMDNAPERRGKLALHEKYGEGLAILVALGLLNASYALVFVNHSEQPVRAVAAHAEIVECVGSAGMVGGQSIDLALARGAASNDLVDAKAERHSLNYDFESSRNLKTSALMRLALRVGAILAGADAAQLAALSHYAEIVGDAYQLGDDLLDLSEDAEIFAGGKTYALDRGHETARVRLQTLTETAKRVLVENFPANAARGNLIELTDYLADRKA